MAKSIGRKAAEEELARRQRKENAKDHEQEEDTFSWVESVITNDSLDVKYAKKFSDSRQRTMKK
eukprot:CAMPEP_0172458294 /NCGR_PEP_ID=MMETSP1065-20121228/26946_1 /TAXON_ID=265537 /ORGANISM="Amphiprora paludosa, Strain CCMP125" /LENGTH=63 /DNA_ID=CAMNT_0013212485 /DNA_START=231 /DNA_END=422 /DNA_ORIENTATION=-